MSCSKYLFSNSPIRAYSKSLLSSYKPLNCIICPAHQMSSTARAPSQSPWLMLPPKLFEGGGAIDYNFYSLGENKVITLTGGGEKELTDAMPIPNNHRDFSRMLRGSSHGWLALFNQRSLDLFLYNPISRRHIKLPSLHNLPNFPPNNPRDVTKVILSCSPDDVSCRAVMIYNCSNWLAFCCPGRSKEWIPIGGTHCYRHSYYGPGKDKLFPKSYKDCVYSSEQELFFGLSNDCNLETWGNLETWDLRDPSSPRMIMSSFDDNPLQGVCRAAELWTRDITQHLVVANHHLFIVTRYIMERVGSYVDSYDENCPHLTVDFDIHKYDPEKGSFPYYVDNVASSLGGSALFIGSQSHTVALPGTQFPELKPNSIYFTDAIGGTGYWRSGKVGGHDIGIFNYQDKTVSSCYYPCVVQSIKMILPKPMWFFPSIYFTDAIGGTGYWRSGKDDGDAPFGGGHDIGIFNYHDKTVSSSCDVQSIKSISPSPVWFFPSSPI